MPTGDTGAALGLLDVLDSSIGVAAPLLGGLLLGAFGADRLPAAGAATYANLGVVLMAVLGGVDVPTSAPIPGSTRATTRPATCRLTPR